MTAALELFARRGFQAVGIRDIAQEAGVSTAALYHYMDKKEDLLRALMSDRLQRIIRVAELACSEVEAPEEQLVALVRVHVISHALFPSNVVDDELRSLSRTARRAIVRQRDRYEQFWDEILERGSAKGGPFSLDSVRFARLALLGMCNSVNRWYSSGPVSVEGVADQFADLALGLVRASRGGKPLHVGELSLPPAEEYTAMVASVYEGGVRG
jgi:AcrR family transcriptional regulator